MNKKEENCDNLSLLISTYSMLQSSFQDIKSSFKFFVSLLLPVILTSLAVFITFLNELGSYFLTVAIGSLIMLIWILIDIVKKLFRVGYEMDEIANMIRNCGYDIIAEANNFTKYYHDLHLTILVSVWISIYLILAIITYLLGV